MRAERQTRFAVAVLFAVLAAGLSVTGLHVAQRHFDARLEERGREQFEATRQRVHGQAYDPQAADTPPELPPGENAVAQAVWWLHRHQAVVAILIALTAY